MLRGHQTRCRNIKIYVNEISVIVGMNKHKNLEDVFLDVWKRSNRNQFDSVIKYCCQMHPPHEGRMKLRNSTPTYNKMPHFQAFGTSIRQKLKFLPTKEHHATRTRSKMSEGYQFSNERFGKVNELNAMKYLEFATKTKYISKGTNCQRLFQVDLPKTLSDVIISGKVDGFTPDGKVIEIKSRRSKIYKHVMNHERIQLQTYLWILNKNEGQLVQYLPLSRTAQSFTMVDVPYDPQYWNDVISPSIRTFAISLDLFMRNNEQQIRFLSQPSKRKELLWGLNIASV